MDLGRRPTYDQERQLSQRAFAQSRDNFSSQPPRDPSAANRGSGSLYSQGPPSASGSIAPDYNLGHHRTNSSSTSSPFVSPRNEYPSYSFSTPNNSLYQQVTRDQPYQYPQSQYSDSPSRQIPQLAHPVAPYRPVPSSVPSQIDQSRPYSRSYETEGYIPQDRGYGQINPTMRQDAYNSQPPSTSYDRSLQPIGRTLPDPSQPLPSVLPPLQSTLPSSQSRRDPLQPFSNGSGLGIERQAQLQLPSQNNNEGQGYLPHLYRNPPSG